MKAIKKLCVAVAAIMLSAAFVGCGGSGEDKKYTVRFEINCELPTNAALDQTIRSGGKVVQPDVQVRGANPDGLRIEGWYDDAEFKSEWDFGLDIVTADTTLYAKWSAYYGVNFYIKNSVQPVYSAEVKKGRRVSPCGDSLYGYSVKNYYSDKNCTAGNEFDFTKPITASTSVYVDVEDSFYFDAVAMSKCFRAVAAVSGAGSTAGSVSYEKKNDEDYIRANFGYSTARDPFIVAEALNIDITKSQIIEIKYKNLGKANQLMLYWILKDDNGNFVGSDDYSANCNFCYTYSGDETNMKEDGEWKILRVNVAAGELSSENNLWTNATKLYTLRVQSLYQSASTADTSNEMLIAYIKGVYDEDYDMSKSLVKFRIGATTREVRATTGEPIGEAKAAKILAGYKVSGFYKDAAYTVKFDPATEIINYDTEIFVKTEEGFSYGAEELFDNFLPTAATDGRGSTVGKATLENGFVRVNFGFSLQGDAGYTVMNARLDISKVRKIRLKIKNLGYADALALYWTAKDATGAFIGNGDYSEERAVWTGLTSEQIRMSEDGEWTIVEFDLSENQAWLASTELVKMRIQSRYVSKDGDDLSNEILFAEFAGVA